MAIIFAVADFLISLSEDGHFGAPVGFSLP